MSGDACALTHEPLLLGPALLLPHKQVSRRRAPDEIKKQTNSCRCLASAPAPRRARSVRPRRRRVRARSGKDKGGSAAFRCRGRAARRHVDDGPVSPACTSSAGSQAERADRHRRSTSSSRRRRPPYSSRSRRRHRRHLSHPHRETDGWPDKNRHSSSLAPTETGGRRRGPFNRRQRRLYRTPSRGA